MTLADDLFDAINDYRVANGKTVLVSDSDITLVAQQRSDYMASSGHFGHFPAGGKTWLQMFKDINYPYKYTGENIHFNFESAGTTVAVAIQSFIDSPEHNATMLEEPWTQLGVAFAFDASDNSYVWTTLFAELKAVDDNGSKTDDNENFSSINNLPNIRHIIWQGLPGVYLATTPTGLYKSVDYGDTWGALRPNAVFGNTWPAGATGNQVSFAVGPRHCRDNAMFDCGVVVIGEYSGALFDGPPVWRAYDPVTGDLIGTMTYEDGDAGEFGAGAALSPLDSNFYGIIRNPPSIVVFDSADSSLLRVISALIPAGTMIDAGSGQEPLGFELSDPRNIVFDSSGDFWVAYTVGYVVKFTPAGVPTNLVQLGSDPLTGIDLSTDGILYGTSQNNDISINSIDNHTETAGNKGYLCVPLWAHDGDTFINTAKLLPGHLGGMVASEYDSLRRLDSTGAPIQSYGTGIGVSLWGDVAVDETGQSIWGVSFDDPGLFARFSLNNGEMIAGPFVPISQARSIMIMCGVPGGDGGPGCYNNTPEPVPDLSASWNTGETGRWCWNEDTDSYDFVLYYVYYKIQVSQDPVFPEGATTTYDVPTPAGSPAEQPSSITFEFTIADRSVDTYVRLVSNGIENNFAYPHSNTLRTITEYSDTITVPAI